MDLLYGALVAVAESKFQALGTSASTTESIPADLAAFVLFFEPADQRLEVFHHGASG